MYPIAGVLQLSKASPKLKGAHTFGNKVTYLKEKECVCVCVCVCVGEREMDSDRDRMRDRIREIYNKI